MAGAKARLEQAEADEAAEQIEKWEKSDRERILSKACRKLVREKEDLERRLALAVEIGKSKPVKFPRRPKSSKGKKLHTMVGMISDTHTHEIVDSERVRGLGHHNAEIGKARLQGLFEDTARQWKNVSKTYDVPEIVIMLMGDYLVNADMHPPDSYGACSESPLEEMHSVAGLLKGGLEHVQRATGANIRVACVPGNHGRMGDKRFVNEPAHSFEHFIHVDIANHFAENERVEVDASPTMDKLVGIGGVNFFVTHGDPLLKGGAGLPGSFQRLWARCKALEPLTDLLLVGHIHQANYFARHGFTNGCLNGYNEYAQKFKLDPELPSQWGFLVTHDKARIGQAWRYWPDV